MQLSRLSLAFAAAASLGLATTAYGDILVYEGFDYAPGSLNGGNGGVGFASGWVTNPDVSVDGSSLSYPAGVTSPTTGGSAGKSGAGVANRDLSLTIDNEAEGTYYFSFLMQRSQHPQTSGSAFMSGLQLQPINNNGHARIDIGVGSDNNLRACVGTENPCTFASLLSNGITYFVLGRLDVSEGNDRLRLSFLNPAQVVSQSEPIVWDIDRTFPLAEGISTIAIRGGSNIDWGVDEIRITTTYAEAVSGIVPEPASLALVIGGALLTLRRRTR